MENWQDLLDERDQRWNDYLPTPCVQRRIRRKRKAASKAIAKTFTCTIKIDDYQEDF